MALIDAGVNAAWRTDRPPICESLVRWAASIILSRAFSLDYRIENLKNGDENGEGTLSLVPWADMLNHDSLADERSCLVLVESSDMERLHEISLDEEEIEDEEEFDEEEVESYNGDGSISEDFEGEQKYWAILRAHKSYRKGQQVFDSYGPWLTSSQLFLDYGFVDANNVNFAVELPVRK